MLGRLMKVTEATERAGQTRMKVPQARMLNRLTKLEVPLEVILAPEQALDQAQALSRLTPDPRLEADQAPQILATTPETTFSALASLNNNNSSNRAALPL
jgi:hypothetical protein